MKKILIVVLSAVITVSSFAQKHKTENVVIVTLDGMRWQEIFNGADSALIASKEFTHDYSGIVKKYWNNNTEERRKLLFPFLWSTVVSKGQLYGNRAYGNYVNVTNPYWFSYPGYNEIFTGYPDTAVNSNDKILNKNENVLEFINKQPGFKNKVAAFSTWDCFPYILNEQRSGVYVNSDLSTLKFDNSNLKLINDIQFLTPMPSGARPDILTYAAGREYLKNFNPRVLYIAFDETDHFAHEGSYDLYLGAAHAEDGMLADLWNTLQSNPQYKDKTTLIVTCDHGRGDVVKSQWRSHGSDIKGADQIWLAVIGPDTKPLGEVRTSGQLYQRQWATTIASLLGLQFKPSHPVMEPVQAVLK
ncbi:alkaline phosphatase family protein [Danxiaibacter flavus]|uniref:Alkaline phosphatase family protein n=1 Tax=Danxiaibacter flavus TaxID=3049108 RepID=A0ABV3ZNF4_9BACT|nr:alkaline phosphatase family protein [Chitinophagaceae bacterium DXS]